MLLSVLPLILLLNALASNRVDDDISQRLGLTSKGGRTLERLFHHSSVAFNFSVLLSLVLALVGTIAVARSVQTTYEKAYGLSPASGVRNLVRCFLWVIAVTAFVVVDGVTSGPLRDEPAGRLVLGLANLAMLVFFFWWSINFLQGGRRHWRDTFAGALATGVFWIGLGIFASLYFPGTIVSDSKLYGPIGVIFSLVTWFIAIGAVIALGAVVGASWHARRARRSPSP